MYPAWYTDKSHFDAFVNLVKNYTCVHMTPFYTSVLGERIMNL